jgi:ketosteroid isomerase-like protein
MNAKEIGAQLVQLCREGKNLECIDRLYADDIESVEAAPPPGGGDRVTKGKAAIRAKNVSWLENHDIHRAEAVGPYPHGNDRFAVRFSYDVTNKPSKRRMQLDEVGLFTIRAGKIVKEEFFYDMG